MNQEGAFFPPQKRKSFCSSGCNHHGYRDCVSTQTEDTGYHPGFDSFYGKMKFLSRKALILWQQWRPTAAARLVNLLNVRVGKVETLSDCAGGQKKYRVNDLRRMSAWRPELTLTLVHHHVLPWSNKTGPTYSNNNNRYDCALTAFRNPYFREISYVSKCNNHSCSKAPPPTINSVMRFTNGFNLGTGFCLWKRTEQQIC